MHVRFLRKKMRKFSKILKISKWLQLINHCRQFQTDTSWPKFYDKIGKSPPVSLSWYWLKIFHRFYKNDLPNFGNSETGTIVLLWPLVTDANGMRGEVIVGSDPVREWWFFPGFVFFILRPGDEWIDTLSPFGLLAVGAEFGAENFYDR